MPIFDPTLVQYFIQIPTYFFVVRYQHMINDDLRKKKITTFSGKVFSSELPKLCFNSLHGSKIAHDALHWVVLYSDQVVLGCSCSSFCRNFLKCELFLSLSATCHRCHRDAEAALEYLDSLDENEPLDGAGVISAYDGSVILLPSDGRLAVSGTEGESEVKSSDGKSLTTRVTTVMIRCAFL